ncbi:MAG: hypothetical protein IPI34_14125 [bacterium]|nr:hypothetical protein [bacterium]
MHRIDRALLVLAIVGGASAAVAQDAPRAQDPRPAQPVELTAPAPAAPRHHRSRRPHSPASRTSPRTRPNCRP